MPDITTYNTRGSLADHVGGAWVDVYSSGGTWYSRAGTLEVLCKFQGLVSFPFDKDVRRPLLESPALACRPQPTAHLEGHVRTLAPHQVRCDLDIGGWMISGAAQGLGRELTPSPTPTPPRPPPGAPSRAPRTLKPLP